MTGHGYSAADLTILTMPEAVRKWPGMYFGTGLGDPRLATRVLCAVARHAFHPAARIAADHVPHVVVDVTDDLSFEVTDDQAGLDDSGRPPRGYEDSMVTPERWLSAAAASVSSRTTVEVWRDGRGFRQVLAGLRPVGPPQVFVPPAGAGTRMAFALDPGFFGAAAIPADLAGLDLHGPYCHEAAGPGEILVRDHRVPGGPVAHRHA